MNLSDFAVSAIFEELSVNLIDLCKFADSFEMSSSLEFSFSESVIFEELSVNLTDFSVSVVLVDGFEMSSIELSLSESAIFEVSANLTDFFELRTDSDFEQVGALASKCEVKPEMKSLKKIEG